MDIDLTVDTILKDEYQRNNKRGGQKHLRCFPSCCGEGGSHRTSGFCGQPVVASFSNLNGRLDLERIWVVASFETLLAKPSFDIGSVLTEIEASALLKTKKQPTQIWYRGKRSQELVQNKVQYVFNSKRKGWHYGWASNKHRGGTKHVVRVYVWERLAAEGAAHEDSIVCRFVAESNPFCLVCRRRVKNKGAKSIADVKRNETPPNSTKTPTKLGRGEGGATNLALVNEAANGSPSGLLSAQNPPTQKKESISSSRGSQKRCRKRFLNSGTPSVVTAPPQKPLRAIRSENGDSRGVSSRSNVNSNLKESGSSKSKCNGSPGTADRAMALSRDSPTLVKRPKGVQRSPVVREKAIESESERLLQAIRRALIFTPTKGGGGSVLLI